MKHLELRIDVSGAAGLGQQVEMAVSVFLPEPAAMPARPLAIFAAPGGGYNRRYYFLNIPGHEGYSEADYHVGRGIIYLAIDHVGFGDSTIPDLSKVSFQTLADTHDACVRQLARALEDGTLANGFPPVPGLFKVGMGQSFGAGVTILTQSRKGTFDAIIPAGKSAIHTCLPQPSAELFEFSRQRSQGVREGMGMSPHKITHEGIDYVYAFHWEDVPRDIIALDLEGGYPLRVTAPDFGSTTMPDCAIAMTSEGAMSEDAARITVPVLIANGERDTCPDPHAEPGAYNASPDVGTFIVPSMAHMHNFASTRQILWRRIGDWSLMLAAAV
ncbi:alpha/beta hydrolase [Novosphingobium malaysiense]|uniref:Serine aminopeptidase S33 domain-containing protein n=1 Tax=Novosphingobium malaysiense TaxID=1348853 RepID=A0A0B1ZIV5_9SPHN|nr:hypothetical protein [Novosphingobium malaysiense]KHK89086.1 hypothetical protein LK12_22390 [Novosphingobium malaysiense]